MPDIFERLGREVDLIDDVCHEFERFYTDDYFHEHSGDRLSDNYRDIIDYTTMPNRLLTDGEFVRLNRLIVRFNDRCDYIAGRLGDVSIVNAYNGAVAQINAINLADPEREEISLMRFASTLETVS